MSSQSRLCCFVVDLKENWDERLWMRQRAKTKPSCNPHQKRAQGSHCCHLQSQVHTQCHWQIPVITWLEPSPPPRKQEDENFRAVFHNASIIVEHEFKQPCHSLAVPRTNEEWLSLLEAHTAGMGRWLGPPLSCEGKIYLRPPSLACGGPPFSVSVSVPQLFFLIRTLATLGQGPL